ncbi:unnamed protein product, partial [Ilex paraguariensis]
MSEEELGYSLDMIIGIHPAAHEWEELGERLQSSFPRFLLKVEELVRCWHWTAHHG